MILINASNEAPNGTFINASKYGNKIQLEVKFTYVTKSAITFWFFKTLDFTYRMPADLEVKFQCSAQQNFYKCIKIWF